MVAFHGAMLTCAAIAAIGIITSLQRPASAPPTEAATENASCEELRVILRRNPWAPLAGSLRAGQARGLRSQARFAQGRPVGSARRPASRRAGPRAPPAGPLR